jgi:hypothetical protein
MTKAEATGTSQSLSELHSFLFLIDHSINVGELSAEHIKQCRSGLKREPLEIEKVQQSPKVSIGARLEPFLGRDPSPDEL